MNAIADGALAPPASAPILDRSRTIARPGFNRWQVPPAALSIHLCIGMAYGFSVFWLPLAQAVGVSKPVACPDSTLWTALFSTSCDWKVSDLGWMYTLFFVFLGSSAAIWGGWLERVGPRRAGVYSALCWCGGLLLSAIGVWAHQLWLMWLGSGVIGGIGLGLGYISPVSTLIKWFPDRRGMATGMAIMGFGGGAMIGSPLANILMNHFKSAQAVGVWQTFVVLATIYAIYMFAGAFAYRVPPDGWTPQGWRPKTSVSAMITAGDVHLDDAIKTPQFWLMWAVLCLNVSAGIGVIGMASPMLQEIFGGDLIGRPGLGFAQLDSAQKTQIAGIAAGFTALLSFFNIVGRFFWASISDIIGRKTTYFIFFILGVVLYGLAPTLAHMGSKITFVAAFCLILSMYGGGFATIPAYLADIFGTRFVGAIHGRILTAWSTAGIIGPVAVNYIREFNKKAGVPSEHLYDATLYVLCGFLIVGLICNAFIRPVDPKWLMKNQQIDAAASAIGAQEPSERSFGIGLGGFDARVGLSWAFVLAPLIWGAWKTLESALKLFQ